MKPRPCGMVRGTKSDYFKAVGSLSVMTILIWAPYALFTFDHTVGHPNLPYEISVSLNIGSFETIYKMTAQTEQIHQ